MPNKLLVGYALDFNEYFRDLMHICILSQEGRQQYSSPPPATARPRAVPSAKYRVIVQNCVLAQDIEIQNLARR